MNPNKTYRKERRNPMKKMRMVISCFIPLVLIVVALLIPAIAEAAILQIWPDQLNPTVPNDPYAKGIFAATGGTFYAPFTLPKGARITQITYYHYGEASPAGTSFAIFRLMMGNAREQLAIGSSTDSTAFIIPVVVSITGDQVIRKGFRYYIGVVCDNANSNFLGVKITYTVP
jgi:hypothetical protein